LYELLGYEVEETGDKEIPYILYGKRGARYALRRSEGNTHILILYDPVAPGRQVSAKGNYTFTDAGGELRPYYRGEPL